MTDFIHIKICLHCGYIAKLFKEKCCKKCCRRLMIRFQYIDKKEINE